MNYSTEVMEALRQSEERYRSVIAAMQEGVVLMDADGCICACNASAERILGLSADQIMGRTTFDPHWQAIHEDGSPFPGAAHPVTETLRTSQPCANVVMGIRKPTGELAWISISSQPLLRESDPAPYAVVASFSDITERKKTEEALRESEHRWRSLTEALPQMVWTARPDGFMDYGGVQTGKYIGRPVSELLGWGWLEMLHPDDRERTRQAWQAAVEGGQNEYEIEHRFRRFDGTYRWFKTRGLAIRDSEGAIDKWFGTCTDITTDKQLEEELRQANERLDLAVRGSNIAIWEYDMPDGVLENARLHDVNAAEQLGYERADAPADHAAMTAQIHPEDRQHVRRAMQACLGDQTREYEVEYRVRHRDSSYRWVLARGIVVRDGNGVPIRFLGSRTDITERKRAEEAMTERVRLASLAADVGVALTGADTLKGILQPCAEALVQYLDAAFARVWTLHESDQVLHLQASAGMYTHTDGPHSRVPVGQLKIGLIAQERCPYLSNNLTNDPRISDPEWVQREGMAAFAGHPLVVQDRLVGVMALFARQPLSDVTLKALAAVADEIALGIERVRHAEAVEQARKAAEAANKSKDEFLATVSHEIRTPMGAILGYTELALQTELTEDQRKCLGTVQSAAENLLRVINDLLDFARIEAGKMELYPDDFSLRAIVGDTLKTLAERAHNKGLALSSQVPLDIPDALIGDAGRLGQVLLNLVGNAIKFTEKGEVVVSVGPAGSLSPLPSWLAACPPDVILHFSVRDTGIGIPPEKQQRIFQAFEQEDASTTRKYGGTGLGLTITSRLVGLMGGQISVDSAPGKGSTFTFTARFSRQAVPSEQVAARAPSQIPRSLPAVTAPLHILVAEDNDFNAQLVEQLLRRRGHRVRLVNNGREALSLAADGIFDVLLLDIHMPEMDGYQVVQAVRDRERTAGGHLPIIALTARARKEDREKCLAAGMDDFLAKPVHADELWAAIDRGVGGRSQESGVRSQQSESSRSLTLDACPLTPDSGLLDARVLLAACGDDDAILGKICQAFRARLPEQLTAIQDAFRDRHALRLREAAHKMCGMVAAFSPTAGSVASELEDRAAQGQLEEAPSLVAQLETMAGKLLRLVGRLSLESLRRQAEAADDRLPRVEAPR